MDADGAVPVMILAGGLGTRLREETEFRPKPMVDIGGRPILWHIMKGFSHHGLNDFIIATGYKGEVIKDYFLNYEAQSKDFTIDLSRPHDVDFHGHHDEVGWRVTVTDTGQETLTGGRVLSASRYVQGSTFLCTYGDGVADVDVAALLRFHREHGRIATVTTVRPVTRFGVVDLEGDLVKQFREKPLADGWVSAGYFVFDRRVLDYLSADGALEEDPLDRLAADGELAAFRHDGFWQPMDTYREQRLLAQMWESSAAPWKVWS